MARINIKSEVAGTVWKVQLAAGAEVGPDESILIVESMKMEIPVESPKAGRVVEVLVKEGDVVAEGEVLVIFDIQ